MVGDIIKQLREEKDISQKQLAKIINISPSTIGMYEQNRRVPSPEILKLIADYFNVSVDYLLGRDDSVSTLHNYESEGNNDVYYEFAHALYNEYKKRDIDLNNLSLDEKKKLAKKIVSILSALNDE